MKNLFISLFSKSNKVQSLNSYKDFENFATECREHLFNIHTEIKRLNAYLKTIDEQKNIKVWLETIDTVRNKN